jgi:DNA modification methylase
MNIDLHHGDCLEVMATLESGSIDAIICDPPYGTTACKWDSVIPFAPMWEQLKRLIKPRGAIVLFGSQPFTSALVMSNPKWFKHEWIWEKDRATAAIRANVRPLSAHENILVFGKAACTYNPQKTQGHRIANKSSKTKQAGSIYHHYIMGQSGGNTDRYPRTVQKFHTVNSSQNPQHPTQKPVALMSYLVKTYTNEGDTVLDFTFGSGTTGVACVENNRSFIGIEKEEKYFNIGCERIQKAWNTKEQDDVQSR